MKEGVIITDFLTYYEQHVRLEPVDVNSCSSLVLAYIRGAVYEPIIRARTINQGSIRVNKMHKRGAQLIKVPTQAALIGATEELLTEEGHGVYKRGCNAKSATTARSVSVIDYRTATGMEALMGWLLTKEEFERLVHIVSQGPIRLGGLFVESGTNPAGRIDYEDRNGEFTGETEEIGDMR